MRPRFYSTPTDTTCCGSRSRPSRTTMTASTGSESVRQLRHFFLHHLRIYACISSALMPPTPPTHRVTKGAQGLPRDQAYRVLIGAHLRSDVVLCPNWGFRRRDRDRWRREHAPTRRVCSRTQKRGARLPVRILDLWAGFGPLSAHFSQLDAGPHRTRDAPPQHTPNTHTRSPPRPPSQLPGPLCCLG